MWQMDGPIASADFGAVTLKVSLSTGDRKVLVYAGENTLVAKLWDMPAIAGQPLVDCYVRGRDLVCLLGPSDSFPFATQLYWTLRQVEFTPDPLAALSLLVSIRTDLLDTHPAIEVQSELPGQAGTPMKVAGGPAYVVPLREELTLVEYATPEDCSVQSIDESANQTQIVRRTLFDHFLEKGVIRSGRLFAAVLSGEADEQSTSTLCRELLASELPLTA